MTKKKKVGVIAIVIAGIIFSCLALFFMIRQAICTLFIYKVSKTYAGPAENFVTKVDAPISLEQARKELKFPLPDEATDIHYAEYAQFMAYEFKVKFTAPLVVCKSHAKLLIHKYNEENPDNKLEFSDISDLPLLSQENTYPPLNITWFDVQNIKNGFTVGTGGSYEPMIWIDTDRSLFYYSLMD